MIDLHTVSDTPSEDVLELMRERMYAFIFPVVPVDDDDKAAFDKAVLWQYQHDASAIMASGEIPSGTTSFRIGDFQMAFKDGTLDQNLNMNNICPSVRGLLLRHGLLYRGVGSGCVQWR